MLPFWLFVAFAVLALSATFSCEAFPFLRSLDFENQEPSEWRKRPAADEAQSITEDEPIARVAMRAHEAVIGKPARLTGLNAITFAGVAIKAGIPSIIVGPGSIEQAHTEDEWIEVAQIPPAARLYAAMIVDLLGPVE